jgi:pyrroloquinoline quinone biosynthesis protein B
LPLDEPASLLPQLRVTPFAVPGKVALYLEDAAPAPGAETEDTVGLELADEAGRRVCFVPGCARVTDALRARLAGADLLLFDGTLWTDDEMIRSGTGHKTGQRMGHVSVSGEAGSLAGLAGVKLGRRIYLHVNNTNPILLADSPERAAVAAAGWEVAFDGMEIAL